MSWMDYINLLKAPDNNNQIHVEHAAIWGHNPISLCASTDGLKNITVEEIQALSGDRSKVFEKGFTLAGQRCVVLRDELDQEGSHMINMKTEKINGKSYFISIGKTSLVYVIAKGYEQSPGGPVSTKVFDVITHLLGGETK